MVARGRVLNGVIVLAEDDSLPEGQGVTVLSRGTSPLVLPGSGGHPHSILDIPP